MLYNGFVRTTLEIDDDVLIAAKELAAHRHSTAGKVLSDLARQALHPPDLGSVQWICHCDGIMMVDPSGTSKWRGIALEQARSAGQTGFVGGWLGHSGTM